MVVTFSKEIVPVPATKEMQTQISFLKKKKRSRFSWQSEGEKVSPGVSAKAARQQTNAQEVAPKGRLGGTQTSLSLSAARKGGLPSTTQNIPLAPWSVGILLLNVTA